MTKKYKNVQSARDSINRAIQESLHSDGVKELVKTQVKTSINTVVYAGYKPLEYKRTYGLTKIKKNYKFSERDGNLVFEHVAMVKSKNLSKLIILGQDRARGMSGVAQYNDAFIQRNRENGYDDFWRPRDFIGHAKGNMKDMKKSYARIVESNVKRKL